MSAASCAFWPSTPLSISTTSRADARHLDARRERRAVAIVDAAALRLDVEPALPLVLGGLLPRGAVLDLHAVRARHERRRGRAPSPRTGGPCGRESTSRAPGSRFFTGPPSRAARASRLRARRPAKPRAIGTMRSGPRRLHAEERARDDLDALGRLVARGLELVDALHLAEARLLLRAPCRARSRATPCARASRGARRTRRRARDDGERPVDEEDARAPERHVGSTSSAASSAPRRRRGAPRGASRCARAGSCALSSSVATSGFFVSGVPRSRDRGTRASRGDPRASGSSRIATRPPGATMSRQRREELLELLELAVHRDAQRLERARRRVDAADAHRPDGAHDRAAKIERRRELSFAERALDAARDAPRAPLVAVVEDDVGELVVARGAR